MAELITPGIIAKLHGASPSDEALFSSQPVVQFLFVRPVEAKGGAPPPGAQQERYRLIVSDGTHYFQAMLATQLNGLVNSGQLVKHSICRLTKFTVSYVKEKWYVHYKLTKHTYYLRFF
jgi:replication factor A1